MGLLALCKATGGAAMKTLYELGVMQGQWEVRSDELRRVRPQLVQHLADMLDCEIKAKIEWADVVGLRTKLGEWIDNLHDGELEDRIAVELDLLEDWERPTY
jgi:hypothetical protein